MDDEKEGFFLLVPFCGLLCSTTHARQFQLFILSVRLQCYRFV